MSDLLYLPGRVLQLCNVLNSISELMDTEEIDGEYLEIRKGYPVFLDLPLHIKLIIFLHSFHIKVFNLKHGKMMLPNVGFGKIVKMVDRGTT